MLMRFGFNATLKVSLIFLSLQDSIEGSLQIVQSEEVLTEVIFLF